MSDQELRAALKRIDEDEAVDVTKWEANFIESVVYTYAGPLSPKQRDVAEKIIDKYG